MFEPEASVIREIYERYASGQGYKKIADALNRKNTPTPRPRKGRISGWDISSIRAALLNPLYRGVYRYNRLKQHDDEGNAIFIINPESEHVITNNEKWRIVSADLAERVDARFATSKSRGLGQHVRRPESAARYLLSGGLISCPACGGNFEVAQKKYYVCATHRRKGASICPNSIGFRVDVLDESIVSVLSGG